MELKSTKDKRIAAIIMGKTPKGMDPRIAKKIARQLSALQAAQTIHQVQSMPGWNLEEKTGPMRGKWSMWVTGNWRLAFRLESPSGPVIDLDYEDYH